MAVMQVCIINWSTKFYAKCLMGKNFYVSSTIGNGGHVVFKATYSVNNLGLISSQIKADNGQNGRNKDRVGKSADHKVISVPVGTIIRAANGKIVGDLDKEGSMFIAARGGAGKEFTSLCHARAQTIKIKRFH